VHGDLAVLGEYQKKHEVEELERENRRSVEAAAERATRVKDSTRVQQWLKEALQWTHM
jgi:hypothetical protein